jgi:hypothetical protein
MKKLYVLALIPAFALASCHGISKCSFAEYKAAAEKVVEKAPEVDTIKWKGNFDGEKMEFTSKTSIADLSVKEIALKVVLLAIDRVDSTYAVENTNATYYKGFGFKVVDGDDKMEYNGKGFLTKVVAKDDGKVYSFSVSHTFVK